MAISRLVRHFERPDGRGYTVNYKYLGLAYFIEMIVVATSLVGAWLFARQYGGGDFYIMVMMLLAPVAYACVELARVPLAFTMRLQSSILWKVFFGGMVIAAAFVTIKSLSQLGEIMFRPRLHEATVAAAHLKDAKEEQKSIHGKIQAMDAIVLARASELQMAEDRLKSVNSDMSTLAKPQCTNVSGTNSRGQRYTTQRCTQDPRVGAMSGNLKNAQESRDKASKNLDEAHATRAKLDPVEADRKVAQAELTAKKAVQDSQLHSFTGMFFGKNPNEVTEAEIHFFLRWFVFFPAIFASLTATALALASVTYDPKKKPSATADMDEKGLQYVLEPLAQAVTERAVAAALAAVKPREPDPNDKIIPLKGASHG